MILILGDPQDEHARHIAAELETRAGDVEFLHSEDFPANIQLNWRPDRTGMLTLANGRPIDTSEIQSVYWRNFGAFSASELPNAGQAHIAMNDARSLFESFLIDLPARWVNGWKGFQLHQNKPAAFAKVAAQGVRVPETIWTNDPEHVRAFAARMPCIIKPVQGGAHTEPVTPELLSDENLQNLRHAPITLQEAIEGDDVRVFVVGDEVYACEIGSDELDFRNDANPDIRAIELTDDMQATCQSVAASLELCWAGIDFRRTNDGEFVFFEANPSSMFLGFEQRANLPITQALCRLLLS